MEVEVEYGIFGKDILVQYCGSIISNQFYAVSNPILLTEHQMGIITTQNIAEFVVFALIAILFQVLFRLYFRSIKILCACAKSPKSKAKLSKNNDKNEGTSTKTKIQLRVAKRKKLKWSKKDVDEWTNQNVIEWINSTSIDLPKQLKETIINEIKNCDCNGTDIAALKSADEFAAAFKITDKPELCDKLFTELIGLKSKKQTKKKDYEAVNTEDVLSDDNEEKVNILAFKINIFSHDENMRLSANVTKDFKIQRIKEIYKAELGIDARLEDIQFYSKSNLLSPHCTLAQVGIVDEKHLISVKFATSGAVDETELKVAGHHSGTSESVLSSNDWVRRAKIVANVWSVILGILIMFHYINAMRNYYDFVNDKVKFATDTLHMDTLDECIESGVGKLPCPALFEQFPDDDDWFDDDAKSFRQGYTLQNAENICSWIYNILIITNPTIFQYSLLASFWVFDTVLYFFIIWIVACVPSVCCNCCAWATCWCSCCCTDCCPVCCPVTHCCTEISWCCAENTCCYCMCGMFGPLLWCLQFAIALVLISVLLLLYSVSLAVMTFIFIISGLVIVYIFALPLSIIHPKLFCCFVFETFIGNGREVDLRVNVIHRNDNSLCIKIRRLLSQLLRFDNGYIQKNPTYMRVLSVILSIVSPLLIIMMIAFVHTFVSGFIIYYVVDGGIYGAWSYFEAFFIGVLDFIASFGETISDPVKLSNYLNYVLVSSVSWKELFSISSDFDSIKYCVLLIRTVLHIYIGIIDTIADPY